MGGIRFRFGGGDWLGDEPAAAKACGCGEADCGREEAGDEAAVEGEEEEPATDDADDEAELPLIIIITDEAGEPTDDMEQADEDADLDLSSSWGDGARNCCW